MKSICSTALRRTLRRTLGVAGLLIGFGLLSAGVASADDGDSPGLLGGVTDLVSPVVKPLLQTAEPVTEPVLAPLAPTVDTAVQALSSVLEPLQPVTAWLLTPVVTQPSAPAGDVPPVTDAPQTETPASVAAPEVHWVALPDRIAVATAPRQQEISAPDVVPPIEVPQRQSPDVPLAMPGTTGSASSSGTAGPAVSDLPAGSGVRPHGESLVVSRDHQVHGSWCYYYGRNHPS